MLGLDGGTTFEFRVTSLNLDGEPTAPSPIVRCTPTQLTRYYVSGSTGNDTNPGTALRPFKTIQAAADWAGAIDPIHGGWLSVAAGTYTYPFYALPTGNLERIRVSGGYTVGPFGTWTQTGAPTSIQLTSFLPTGKNFVDGQESTAGLIVAERRFAKFDNLQIVAQPSATEQRCSVALFAGNVVLQSVSISTTGNVNARCRAAIHAHSDSGLGAVRIRGSSKITGFDMQASTASIYQLRSIGIGGT
ncbi:MAG TPA: hypothetical protein VF331_15985, partial [Polyangiales bacterium]